MKPSSMALPTSLERRRETNMGGVGREGRVSGFKPRRWKRRDEE